MDHDRPRRPWIWDERTERPIELDPSTVTKAELLEALDYARRETSEVREALERRIETLEAAVSRLAERLGDPDPGEGLDR